MLLAALSLPRLGLGDARQLPRAVLRAGREPQLDMQLFSPRPTGSIVEPAMVALTDRRRSRGEAVALAGLLSNSTLDPSIPPVTGRAKQKARPAPDRLTGQRDRTADLR
jgi:hypothetical protein